MAKGARLGSGVWWPAQLVIRVRKLHAADLLDFQRHLDRGIEAVVGRENDRGALEAIRDAELALVLGRFDVPHLGQAAVVGRPVRVYPLTVVAPVLVHRLGEAGWRRDERGQGDSTCRDGDIGGTISHRWACVPSHPACV